MYPKQVLHFIAPVFSVSEASRKPPHHLVLADNRQLDTEGSVRGCRMASMDKNEVQGDGGQQEDAGGSDTRSRKEKPS
jgi:hypothetical protein